MSRRSEIARRTAQRTQILALAALPGATVRGIADATGYVPTMIGVTLSRAGICLDPASPGCVVCGHPTRNRSDARCQDCYARSSETRVSLLPWRCLACEAASGRHASDALCARCVRELRAVIAALPGTTVARARGGMAVITPRGTFRTLGAALNAAYGRPTALLPDWVEVAS